MMMDFWMVEDLAREANRSLSGPERERMALLMERDRRRGSRRWLARSLVTLGMRLDPGALEDRDRRLAA